MSRISVLFLILKSTTQQSPIPVQRSPLKSEPLFLISGRGDKPIAPRDFKLHLDFLLYDRIRLHQHEGEPHFYTLEVVQIYYEFVGVGRSATEYRIGDIVFDSEKPLFRQIKEYPKVELAPWVEFEPDHSLPFDAGGWPRVVRPDPCSAALCKYFNDAEYCDLLTQEQDAISKDAEDAIVYYQDVKKIFGDWYHRYDLQLPDCTLHLPTGGEEENNDLELAKCLASTQSRMEYIGKLRAEGGTWEDTFDKLDALYERLSISRKYKNPDSLKRSYNRYEVRRRQRGNNVPGK